MDERQIKHDLDRLAEKDGRVAEGLALVGYPPPRIRPHGFETLLRIIVGQQISTHAADAILTRLDAALPEVTPEGFLALGGEELRAVGFSGRKIEYANGIAEAILSGALDIERLAAMNDTEVIKELVKLRGIGVWTAEIYAMFSLGRRDVFPADDIALQEALRRLRGLAERPSGKEARKLVENWAPWRSVGVLFLWAYYRGAPR
mgnify:CR=1 FL=1